MKIKTAKILKSKVFEKTENLCIFFHGYGTNGNDFFEAVEFFMPDYLKNTLFLFPNGPFDCEIGEGYQWFSLKDISYESLRSGLELAGPLVFEYISEALDEYQCRNLTLLGFSQGAIMSFEMLYYCDISKLVSFSGLFAASKNKTIKSANAKILMLHSEDDPVVPYRNVALAQKTLADQNLAPKVITFQDIGHSISKEGWQKAFSFIS